MADDFIELFVKCPADVAGSVREWFEKRGLRAMMMKSGLLLSGTKEQVEQVLSISLAKIQLPANLPIPSALSKQVVSITLPRPRSYHA
jgi:hypothetical protein